MEREDVLERVCVWERANAVSTRISNGNCRQALCGLCGRERCMTGLRECVCKREGVCG